MEQLPVLKKNYPSWIIFKNFGDTGHQCADTASISFHSQTAQFPTELCELFWSLQYFCILLFAPSVLSGMLRIPPSAALDSSRFKQGGGYFIELWNDCSFQSQLLPPMRERGTLAWELGLITNRLAETAKKNW